MTTREAVVAEALSWECTPYHHRGRVKGVGVDCAMLPACVYEAVGLIDRLDPQYSSQWMMHRDEEQFLNWVIPHSTEIDVSRVGPGDLLIWKFGRTFSHSAIVLNLPEVIHAVANAGMVVRGNIERDTMFHREMRCFTLWGD